MAFKKKITLILLINNLIFDICAVSVEKPRQRRFASPIGAIIIKSGARLIPPKYILAAAVGVSSVIGKNIVTQNLIDDSVYYAKTKFGSVENNQTLDSNYNSSSLLVKKRRVAPAVLAAAEITGWLTAAVARGVAISVADIAIREAWADNRIEKLKRRTPDCQFNNFGCIAKRCWSNCGPRLTGGDWCLTTKNATIRPVQYAT